MVVVLITGAPLGACGSLGRSWSGTVTIRVANIGRAALRPAGDPLGGGVDGHGQGETAQIYTPHNLRAMLSAGLGPLACRLRELGQEAWHWNHYTQEAHPQRVIIDLGRARSVDAVWLDWAQPDATRFVLERWVGSTPPARYGGERENAVFAAGPAQGTWVPCPQGRIGGGHGGRELLRIANRSSSARYVRTARDAGGRELSLLLINRDPRRSQTVGVRLGDRLLLGPADLSLLGPGQYVWNSRGGALPGGRDTGPAAEPGQYVWNSRGGAGYASPGAPPVHRVVGTGPVSIGLPAYSMAVLRTRCAPRCG